MAQFFIGRPVFSWVIAVSVMVCGILCIPTLPVSQYPDVALPQISIYGQYPGASAKIVDQSVTQIIEQQMKGLDNLLYMRSSSDSLGNIEMYFTFAAGTDGDIAQVQVQNKVQQALPQLPEEVQRQGLQVTKAVENSFMTIAIYAASDNLGSTDISDYVASNVLDTLARVQGVGSTTLYGGQNAMRIWLDPEKMLQYRLNPSDISAAIRSQNAQVAGGQVGAAPALPGQEMNFTVNAASRLEKVEDFAAIRLRVEPDGSILHLKDVARIELNQENFLGSSWYNGHEGVGIGIKLATGANVLETTKAVKKEMATLARFFPPGLAYAYADDRAPIVEKSIHAVVRTLLEAIFLVVVVMFCFMQSLRATIIPTLAIPVVLLGVFAVLAIADFSINTLTMFGMVLAIGLLVDDAIVVVENVERLMRQDNLAPKEATIVSMRQISGALLGVAVVISAVFVPMAFMGGSTGIIYRQFSITIVSAMILSVIVAIVFTPTLCATMLRPTHNNDSEGFFGKFNRLIEKVTRVYGITVRNVLQKPALPLSLFAAVLAAICILYTHLPSAFLPEEDQGILFVDIQLPPGATFERTEKIIRQLDTYFREKEKDAVDNVFTVMGWGFSGSGQGSAMLFPQLKDWSQRDSNQSVFALMKRFNRAFSDIPEAAIFIMSPPAIMELGNSAGFNMELMDRGGKGHDALFAAKNELLEKAAKRQEIAYARYSGLEDDEQYDLKIDIDKAGALGLDKGAINDALNAYWGGEYVNDFSDKGRTKKVYIQAEPSFRSKSTDFNRYHIRNDQGRMTPFSSFLSVESTKASPKLTRYQGVPSVKIEGEAAAGKSSGEAMLAMDDIAATLPPGFDTAWSGLSYQELQAGNQAPFLYAISILVVFLCLAALYESWAIPLAVLFAVPTGIVGALGGVFLRGMNNDIYFQLAMLTIVGLSAKNSILIVEFAKQLHDGGKNVIAATIEASKLRLRPIVMTSLCFILGVIPLTIANGAGSGAQNALGTAVIAGMITATALGIYYTPLFFVLVLKCRDWLAEKLRVNRI